MMDAEMRSHVVWVAALRRELRALIGRWAQMPGLCGVPEWRGRDNTNEDRTNALPQRT